MSETALDLAETVDGWSKPGSWQHGEFPSDIYCIAIATTLREQAAEIERLRMALDCKDDIEARNAGAESFAMKLLSDDLAGVMSPGPCAGAVEMIKRLRADATRLDWMEKNISIGQIESKTEQVILVQLPITSSLRLAIDARMKQ